jgi:L-arabinose isomerase
MTTQHYNLKIGLFGIGLEAYWEQFEGLKETLENFLNTVYENLSASTHEIINLGLVDTPEKAMKAGHIFRREDVDIIFLHVTTYALSATVLPVVQRSRVPVIILNLSPANSIDYKVFNALGDRKKMTGEWLKFCSACPVPEIANVFKRAGIRFHQITGILYDDVNTWAEVAEWINAAEVANVLFHNKLGAMGNYYSGMLDIYSDLTRLIITFGGQVEIIEVDELTALRETCTEQQITDKLLEIQREMDVQPDCQAAELRRASITAVALDKLVEIHQIGSLAYYHKGSGIAANEDTMSSIILGTSLLTSKNIPVAGEYELKNAYAMKIMDAFGAGGSFTEFYAMDFNDDIILMGHDGPGHIKIAEGKIKVKPLQVYHGKVGHGLSVEMKVKHGPVTLLSVVETNEGKIELLVAEGESVAGPILEIGNTNSRYKFPIGIRQFVSSWNSHGPAHHCAVGIGHIASKLKKLGELLNIEVTQVC